jgi:hypothetical protein
VSLRTGSRVDQITLVNTRGGRFGPYGNAAGTIRDFPVETGDTIIGFYGRANNEIDRLGVYYQSHAIDRIEINGPFNYNLITQDLSDGLNFDNVGASKVTLNNCDPASTSPLTGSITFSESVSSTETYTQSSTSQTEFGVSATAGVAASGFGVAVSASVTVSVGQSFSETTEFGESQTVEQAFSFDVGFQAQPGEFLIAEATYQQVDFVVEYTVPVLVYYLSDPDTPDESVLEGEYRGERAFNGDAKSSLVPCPAVPGTPTISPTATPATGLSPPSGSILDQSGQSPASRGMRRTVSLLMGGMLALWCFVSISEVV